MSQITITDEAVLSQIDSGIGPISVHDGDGKLRGYLVPVRLSDLQPLISEEELERRELDTTSPRFTTEEVIAKLRSL